MKSSTDPVTRLAELEHERDTCRQAEQDVRDEHARLQRAVPLAREQLTEAVATGGDIKAAEKRFEAAQRAASDPATSARAEGLAQRTRAADVDVQRHKEEHLTALVEAIRPKAEAAVQAIKDRAGDLRDALAEYHQVGGELARATSGIQWFALHRQMPPSPLVDELTGILDPCRFDDRRIPLPMPRSTESPAAEAERLAREHESAQQAGRIVCRGCGKAIHPNAGSGIGYCVRCTARVPVAS
jgi:hypothetical protein